MIHFIVGKRNEVFEKTFNKVLTSFGKNSETVRVDATSPDFHHFYDHVQTPSLFGELKVFVISNLFENENIKKEFFEKIEGIQNAPHAGVILLENILAADLKKIEGVAEVHKITEKEKKDPPFNSFVLANMFAIGDRKKTWITFQQVLAHEDEMEKIHGMMWWKLKDMMGKKGIFSKEELQVMARKLVAVYHDSRLGGLTMAERLEEFFLTMPYPKK